MLFGAKLPRWATTEPNVTLPSAGLPSPKGVAHYGVYEASTAMGAYNHGPIITSHDGTYAISWYNGVLDESVANRVLFALSSDGETWSEPRVLFNTTAGSHRNQSRAGFPSGYNVGLENEPWLTGESGDLYAVASSWDVYQRRGPGAEHAGPEAALVRKVELGSGADIGAVALGPVFWLADEVPAGFAGYCNLTYRDEESLGSAVTRDLTRLRARLVSTVPADDASAPNERSVYALPSSTPGALDLVMLMRSGVDKLPRMWAASSHCVPPPPSGENERAKSAAPQPCRPGTGINNYVLLPPPPTAARVDESDGGGDGGGEGSAWRCTAWTAPQPTTIPDSHSRTCAASLADGRRWLVGAMLPKNGDRTPLTLALSHDGVAWDAAWSLRGEDTLPPIRFHGVPGFQYPSGMQTADGQRLLVAYSVNKESIAVTSVPLESL